MPLRGSARSTPLSPFFGEKGDTVREQVTSPPAPGSASGVRPEVHRHSCPRPSLIPIIKGGPALYRWRARRKILRWYARLKVLDHRLTAATSHENLLAYTAEIQDIEEAVKQARVPLSYADQYYSLRAAVDLVRQRIAAHGAHPTLASKALTATPSFG